MDALRREIEQKRIHLKEQKSGKNYRKIRRRKKLQDKVFEESVLIKTMPNACFLLGLCVCNAICMEDNDVAVEMKEWVKYVGDILKEREKEV